MKTNTIVHLLVTGLLFLPATLHSQGFPGAAPAEESPAAGAQKGEAANDYKRSNGHYVERLQAIVRRGPGSPGRSLVIRSSELDPKEQANLEEDLVVMSHLLEKTIGNALGTQPQASPVLGVDLVFAPGANAARGIYLEGYGALFTLSVGFPLLPSPKDEGEKESPTTDSTWNEARQEVFSQHVEGKTVYPRGEEYDERRVNKLKDTVLEALKNATHIRGMKGEDSITVCVFGAGATLPFKIRPGANKPGAPVPGDVYVAGGSRTTILTIRVKKSDVDLFAKDKLNLDDFRKRAKITPYSTAMEATGMNEFGGFGGGFSAGGSGSGGGGGFGASRGY